MEENKYVYKKPKKKITPFAVFNTILFIGRLLSVFVNVQNHK